MRWPLLWLLAAGCFAGCSGSGQTLDPFLGRATVQPPGTGQLAPPNVSVPYYQGAPPPGSPPVMGQPPYNPAQPPYNQAPQIGPVGSNPAQSSTGVAMRPTGTQKIGRLLAESPGDREYRVGRAGLSANNQPVLIVNDSHPTQEQTAQTAGVEASAEAPFADSADPASSQLVSATEPISNSTTTANPATGSQSKTRSVNSEPSIKIPTESFNKAPTQTASRDSKSNDVSRAADNEIGSEPRPFNAPSDAVEISQLPRITSQTRSPRVNRSSGGFRPSISTPNSPRGSTATRARSTTQSANVSGAKTASATQTSAKPKASFKANRSGESSSKESRFGHAKDYGWVKGKLEYLQSKKQWKLRYIPIDGETDEYGGSVVVEGDLDLSEFRPGDFVAFQGKLDEENTDPGTFAPLYLATRVKRMK